MPLLRISCQGKGIFIESKKTRTLVGITPLPLRISPSFDICSKRYYFNTAMLPGNWHDSFLQLTRLGYTYYNTFPVPETLNDREGYRVNRYSPQMTSIKLIIFYDHQ